MKFSLNEIIFSGEGHLFEGTAYFEFHVLQRRLIEGGRLFAVMWYKVETNKKKKRRPLSDICSEQL